MPNSIDAILVVVYLVFIIGLSIYYTLKYKKQNSADDFLTGGRHMNWRQTGMSLIGMMFDPGIMGNSAFAFVWGYYVVQWNAVNIWFTAPFAAMFFIAIYWRSKITTTTEYLEKRFNYASRAIFSLIMIFMLISWLAYGVYMGGVILKNFLGWDLFTGSLLMISICAFMVILGGVRTMLSLSIVQTFLLIAAILGVGVAGFILVGGFPGIKEMTDVGRAGTEIKSLIPPMNFNLFSQDLYPFPAIPFCIIAGMSWIVCNFSMGQRLLAAKDESHAQKSLIMAGVANAIILLLAYTAGVAMRKIAPEINGDDAFMQLLLKFPIGVKGLLLIGLIAALLSSKTGLLAASGTLFVQDIYARIIKKGASQKHLTMVVRIVELIIVVIVILTLPFFQNASEQKVPAYELIQVLMGDVLGVIIAIYLLGVFSKRSTPWATFTAVIVSMLVGVYLHYFLKVPDASGNMIGLNFWVVGTVEFIMVIVLGLLFSYFEKPKTDVELSNLTVWTLSDIKGPWIGLKSWPKLWRWMIALPLGWLLVTFVWELYMNM